MMEEVLCAAALRLSVALVLIESVSVSDGQYFCSPKSIG